MNKQYEIKYENKSIFFNGNLDYLFNALHDDNEPKANTGDDIISLANFISEEDENIKRKRGRPKLHKEKEIIEKKPRGRPPKPPITTAIMNERLLEMLRKYQLENGIIPENNDKQLEIFNNLFEPFCVS